MDAEVEMTRVIEQGEVRVGIQELAGEKEGGVFCGRPETVKERD